MTIYIVNFNDQGNYAAYTAEAKAKEFLWAAYCEEIPAETREKYLEEDKKSLEDGYIINYGWITEIELYNEKGEKV